MSNGESLFFLELANTFVYRKYKGEKKFSTVKSESKLRKLKAADFSCNNINNSLRVSMKWSRFKENQFPL